MFAYMVALYSLGPGASQVKRGEQHFDALPGASQEDVQTLARVVGRIPQRRGAESAVLRATRSRHERLVAFCIGNRIEIE